MGALLARDGTLADRSTNFYDNELGIDPVSIATTASGLIKPIASLFGGGSDCSAAKQEQRQQMEADIGRYLTESDKAELVGLARSNIAPTADAMAGFFVGGRDCKHKNVSPGDQRFLDALPRRIRQRKQQAAAPGTNLPANMSLPVGPISPATKYSLIGLGVLGAGTLGYLGYQKLKN